MTELPKRKPNRLKDYDYSQNGTYYITICTKDRAEFFGKITIEGSSYCPHIELSEIGETVDFAIRNVSCIYPIASVDTYVIMPNHVHMIIALCKETGRQVAAPTINRIVGNMKRAVSIKCGFSPWQKSYHDHIIRNNNDYHQIVEYIANNLKMWREDCFYQP
jgi:REP element-mobilizing transposase RayT